MILTGLIVVTAAVTAARDQILLLELRPCHDLHSSMRVEGTTS